LGVIDEINDDCYAWSNGDTVCFNMEDTIEETPELDIDDFDYCKDYDNIDLTYCPPTSEEIDYIEDLGIGWWEEEWDIYKVVIDTETNAIRSFNPVLIDIKSRILYDPRCELEDFMIEEVIDWEGDDVSPSVYE